MCRGLELAQKMIRKLLAVDLLNILGSALLWFVHPALQQQCSGALWEMILWDLVLGSVSSQEPVYSGTDSREETLLPFPQLRSWL